MTNRPPETGVGDSDVDYEREPAQRLPRWVKVVGIVVAVVIVLVVIMVLVLPAGSDGGGHGPRRHGSAGGPVPPAGVALVLVS
jgi:hypothetical protein